MIMEKKEKEVIELGSPSNPPNSPVNKRKRRNESESSSSSSSSNRDVDDFLLDEVRDRHER